MKHIGIVAHSAEGSSLCYLEICHEGSSELGDHMHPEITMSMIPMGASLADWELESLQPIRARLLLSAERLKAAGCDFFVCPDNTAHLALESAGPELPLPGLHIADVVVSEAVRKGYLKLGILGTKWTMSKSMYYEAARRRNIAAVAPNHEDSHYIHHTIFSELCNGVVKETTRQKYFDIIGRLKKDGCNAVVLGCTEIPLLISAEQSPLPILDSTRLLAQYALKVALDQKHIPNWRAGHVKNAVDQ
ncbi:amino acid racemase [Mesorhizobium sp. M0563]|uniref:aspartate/glutamate racemase family protein n=1 Tax=Mesorhizobium sp. M0563 TaxID=2956959 RepID=UPI003335FF8B